MKKNRMVLLVFFGFLLSGCMEVVDFYIGIPLQPDLEEDSFVPGLNVFGVIRPDSIDLFNNSFVSLQKVIPAVGSSDSLDVGPAAVRVEMMDRDVSASVWFDFVLTDYGVFRQEEYRPSGSFRPSAGERLKLSCTYLDLPVLTAETTVPYEPVIVENTARLTGDVFSFEVSQDSSLFMLDVYAYGQGKVTGYTRLPTGDTANTAIAFSPVSQLPDSIVVYGYDYNLSMYYLTSNTSLNFNKYRESFRVVENGYGVFGSLNLSRYRLDQGVYHKMP